MAKIVNVAKIEASNALFAVKYMVRHLIEITEKYL